MSSRILALQRGKTGETQRYSLAAAPNPGVTTRLQLLIGRDSLPVLRNQAMLDPSVCTQFACRWGDTFGFFTRPFLGGDLDPDGNPFVLGSFSDTIGQAFPVAVSLHDFQGFFSTLVSRSDANRFHLAIHPKEPDTIPGPTAPATSRVKTRAAGDVSETAGEPPHAASMDRLNWDFPNEEDPTDGEEPVIALLPIFLPIGPGQTFHLPGTLSDPQEFPDNFPLLEVWRKGIVYAQLHNQNRSVTVGGPLFNLPSLAIDDGQTDPFARFLVRPRILGHPNQLPPDCVSFSDVVALLKDHADTVWVGLGNSMEAETPANPPPNAYGHLSKEDITSIVTPLVNKDKDFRLYRRVAARYRILLGGPSPVGAGTDDIALLPDLNEDFDSYLKIPTGATAADELKELLRTAILEANSSPLATLKDVTLDPHCATLAFSDRARTFSFVTQRLVSLTLTMVRDQLGVMQFLTPCKATLAVISECDTGARTLVMANVSNSSSQIDATKSSKLYTGGNCTTFRSMYEAVCNLNLFFKTITEAAVGSFLCIKLTEYASILTDSDGKSFFDAYCGQSALAVHVYQDLQHILSAFAAVATHSSLTKSVQDGGDITIDNYRTPLDVADGHIACLRNIIRGNGLGAFRDVPYCASWFGPGNTQSAGTKDGTKDSAKTATNPKRSPGVVATLGPGRAADLTQVTERLRSLGTIEYDAGAPRAKTDFLEKVPAKAKKRGARVPERLCMKFLTKGFACTDPGCKRPHIPNLNTLHETERKKLIEFVSKTPGLSWVEGKVPAATAASLLILPSGVPRTGASAHSTTKHPRVHGPAHPAVAKTLDPAKVPEPPTTKQRILDMYPMTSIVTPNSLTVHGIFSQSVQNNFRADLDKIDPRIGAKLDQPFGKENLTQLFVSEAALRHVLLPLWKSGFLYGDDKSWDALCRAYYPATILRDLLQDYGDVPFDVARGFNPTWSTETEVNRGRVAATTAAFLHFNGSVADMVRWMGGPHVGSQRDHDLTMSRLAEAGVDQRVQDDIRRIFYSGIPAACTAFGTERNFSAYYKYGNHTTVDEEPGKTYDAMVKDARKGFTVLLDERVLLLMLHCHLTPQGVVDLNTPYKSPRPIFDSTFRPEPWCNAINDWTSPANEPPLTFAGAEMGFMIWMYNLRVSYPQDEIYIGDDDISGAFRLMKYHPNLMSFHSSRQCGYCVVNTGGTFGDNTNPSNFDPLTVGRRQIGHYLWHAATSAHETVKPYLPELRLAGQPTHTDINTFRPADRDDLNPGVLQADGTRKPPPYNMHVDDALYADIGRYMIHTICVSILALFWLLGFPTNPQVPSPLSSEKFEAFYNHERKLVGRRFNSRTLSVGILGYKLDRLRELVTDWTTIDTFDLMQIAHLLGVLENHTRYARWARCWFFSLQNGVRRVLHQRYQILKRVYSKRDRSMALSKQLPAELGNRVHNLIAKEQAHFLWATKQRFVVTGRMKESLHHIHAYLHTSDVPWDVPLGLIVPRVPHITSRGDASLTGGGAYSESFHFWFDIPWSTRTRRGTTLASSDPEYVHINSLEFVVVILQLAAIQTRMDDIHSGQEPNPGRYFPYGTPDIPVWLGDSDNCVSVSWENRVTSKSSQGQSLLSIYAELLRKRHIHTTCQHLAGKLNVIADDISRNDFSLPLNARHTKLCKAHPLIGTLDYFRPSPELVQLLTSRLYSKLNPVPCVLPTRLGHFEPVSSTTCISAEL